MLKIKRGLPMFYYEEEKLNALVTEFKEKIKATFSDSLSLDFSVPAVLAACMTGPCDMEWTLEHYYAKKWAPLLPELVRLYDALVENKRDVTNRYEIGSCDRYVGYVANPEIKAKVMLFENQNITYAVVVREGYCWDKDTNDQIPSYVMHVRIITPSRYSMDIKAVQVDKVDQSMLKGCDSKRYDDKASEYFRYQDLRDRGYIVTVEPDLIAYNGKPFYKIERPNSSHQSSLYVLEELQSFVSMMDEIVKKIANDD